MVAQAPFEARAATSQTFVRARRCPSPGAYRLFAIDLDGTLLNRSGTAHEKDIARIAQLMARGIHVTILTGRLFSGTRPTAELLSITGPVGCADGSHVVAMHDSKTLVHRGIRGKTAANVRSVLDAHNLAAFVFAEDAIIYDDQGLRYVPYVRTWSTDLRIADRVCQHKVWDSRRGITAVVALGEAEVIQGAVSALQASSQRMQIAHFPFRYGGDSEQWALIARASGGTKGTALAWMAKHYGISLEETVCIGDWTNDVPMLQSAGRSFAMGQAPDDVKNAATDVLESTIESGGGIAEAIDRAFGRF